MRRSQEVRGGKKGRSRKGRDRTQRVFAATSLLLLLVLEMLILLRRALPCAALRILASITNRRRMNHSVLFNL
jgi:hypothetical protein